ncbi:MAG: shikimate dehydrogenase [Planctomycetota bacterium]
MAEAIQATAHTNYVPASQPTIYFIGMTTGKSSIMRVFPRWAEYLKLGGVAIQGIDCKWHDDPAVYRRAVEFIKHDPLSQGALVTTHKIDLLKACRGMFEYLDPYAQLMGEVSSISKRSGQLRGHAKDPISSGLALEVFLPKGHWQATCGEVFCLGAGGSAVALTSCLLDARHGANKPARIIVSNRSAPRLEEMKKIHDQLVGRLAQSPALPRLEYHHAPRPEDNDALLHQLPPHSLVANATGLGKDAPGSPLTSAGRFPEKGFAWDFNYRGDLVFLEQARAQAHQRQLTIEDGWVYFIHGWTRAVAEIFDVDIPTSGPKFDDISRLAKEAR